LEEVIFMPSSLCVPNKTLAVSKETIEIAVKGKWIRVPTLEVGGKHIVVKGRWIKTAVVEAEEYLETEVEDPELCVKKLKEQRADGLRADIFTFAQKLPSTEPRYNYLRGWDSVAAVRTSSFKDWWERLPQSTRKNVRRSQKRDVVITVKELDDELIKSLEELNNECPVRSGRPYPHYGKNSEEVRKDQESFAGRRDLVWAHVGNQLVGFLKIIYRGDIASLLHLVPRISEYDRRPANAMLAKVVEICEAKGISYLTYGMFNYGNKRDSPLREFKMRNGFEEILVPRYYIPLTMKGAVCIKLRLHRGLHGTLPPFVIRSIASLRAWYHRKMGRCSSMVERPNRNRQTGCSNPSAGSNL
jgi:hypothetical protein